MAYTQPTLIYDGDCLFCCKCVERLRALLAPLLSFRPYQECAPEFPQIPAEKMDQSVHLVYPDGQFVSAAQAVFASLALRWEGKPLLWFYHRLPVFASLSEAVYKIIAGNRSRISAWDRALTGLTGVIPSYSFSSWLFLRGLGLVFLIAFISLWLQLDGLIGSHGIVPAETFLAQAYQKAGLSALQEWPSLFWLNDSDAMLQGTCLLGLAISLFAMCGFGGASAFLVLWFLYLSFVNVGSPFFSFQWDNLLLETAFLAVLFSPWKIKFTGPAKTRPSFLGRWLLLFLLFRLMFASGVVKLASGDPAWSGLSALQYHYETQPLPTPLAYFAHHLPASFQSLSVVLLFFVELVLPFFIFGPRRLQLLAAASFLLLQAVIALTGNYCFFNLLTALLCLLLIDDSTWLKWARRRTVALKELRPAWRFSSRILYPFAALTLFVFVVSMSSIVLKKKDWPLWVYGTYDTLLPFRSLNNYGLFAVMTTNREEIVMEGSNDGSLWLEYRFKWKPGDVKSAPRFVAPYQPRLDWQMWFAALGTYQQNPWMLSFGEKLLRGSPEVLSLLAYNPYPGRPPKFIRAVAYEYHFSDPADLSKNGQWWTATFKGIYLPALSLKQ